MQSESADVLPESLNLWERSRRE